MTLRNPSKPFSLSFPCSGGRDSSSIRCFSSDLRLPPTPTTFRHFPSSFSSTPSSSSTPGSSRSKKLIIPSTHSSCRRRRTILGLRLSAPACSGENPTRSTPQMSSPSRDTPPRLDLVHRNPSPARLRSAPAAGVNSCSRPRSSVKLTL